MTKPNASCCRVLSSLFSAIACNWASAQATPSADKGVFESSPASSLVYYRSLRSLAETDRADWERIDPAIESNPALVGKSLDKLSQKTDLLTFLNKPDFSVLKMFQSDVSKQIVDLAVSEHRIVVQQDDLLLDTASDKKASLDEKSDGHYSQAIVALSVAALQEQIFIIRPVCRQGLAQLASAGTSICIGGDPWSPKEFVSVVPLLSDGKVVCTATLLSNNRAITAAHCVTRKIGDAKYELTPFKSITVVRANGSIVKAAHSPRVPNEWLACPSGKQASCENFDFDFAVVDLDATVPDSTSVFPKVSDGGSATSRAVTIAGYGDSTVKNDSTKPLLNIGPQFVDLSSKSNVFSWSYNFATGKLSSLCKGDSGGPIFVGNPRNVGDPLTLLGVLSKYMPTYIEQDSVTECEKATAVAVNFSSPIIHSALCGVIADPTQCN